MYLSTKSLCCCEQNLRRYTTPQRFLEKQLLTHALIYLIMFKACVAFTMGSFDDVTQYDQFFVFSY